MVFGLADIARTGIEMREEDIARLWPLGWEHVNFLGRFSFALVEPVARGEMRPLLVPDEESP